MRMGGGVTENNFQSYEVSAAQPILIVPRGLNAYATPFGLYYIV